ncbi:hypothetical protein UFOVP266_46 [uncultured Caudovirales phage]|uniref:Uncharacterized protein n=1 Tax=uncultured Caudovirales phage TaxID=2100421 RepID=A0A6J5LJH6_9CAUD|nr:hypothetical protein UFOVP266_46 [uncultured Caudovirales phage]
MDTQTLLNWLAGIALAAGGWFSRQLWDASQELRRDLHQLEVDLPKEYVQKIDLDKRMQHIEEMFQRIYDKLDAKADK